MKLNNITKLYGENKIFEKFSLNIEEGKITVILGISGIGKTTLLNIIARQIKDFTGEIISQMENQSISYIFQEETLISWENIYNNLKFVLKNKISKEEIDQRIEEYLKIVNLEKYKDYYPSMLSGGMKRRVSIARAFAYPSQYLLMDEPFEFLDIKIKNEILDDFLNMQKTEKRTIILVTHDIDLAFYLGDSIAVLNSQHKDGPIKIIENFNNSNNIEKNNIEKLKREVIEYIY